MNNPKTLSIGIAGALALLSAPLFGSRVEAQTTTKQLYEWCKGGVTEEGLCYGYFIGASDIGIIAGHYMKSDPDRAEIGWCKGDAKPLKNKEAWESYVAKNPDVMQKPALVSYVRAMIEAYPCS